MDMESITISQSLQNDKSNTEKFTKTEMESTLEIGFWSGEEFFLQAVNYIPAAISI